MHEIRAPPLSAQFQVRGTVTDDERQRARRRVGRWSGATSGLIWSGVLLAVLLGMGRVPWLEALLWSALSGTLVGRSLDSLVMFVLRRITEFRSVEIGIDDPQAFRSRMARSLRRRGFKPVQTRLGADRYEHQLFPTMLPPVRVAWAGAGAVLEGPRWALQVALRQAVA